MLHPKLMKWCCNLGKNCNMVHQTFTLINIPFSKLQSNSATISSPYLLLCFYDWLKISDAAAFAGVLIIISRMRLKLSVNWCSCRQSILTEVMRLLTTIKTCFPLCFNHSLHTINDQQFATWCCANLICGSGICDSIFLSEKFMSKCKAYSLRIRKNIASPGVMRMATTKRDQRWQRNTFDLVVLTKHQTTRLELNKHFNR